MKHIIAFHIKKQKWWDGVYNVENMELAPPYGLVSYSDKISKGQQTFQSY